MSSKINDFFSNISLPHKNKEIFFLSLLVIFSITVRVTSFSLVTITAITFFLLVVFYDFFFYVNNYATTENKNIKTTEFSWGFIKEKREVMDFFTFINYLYNKEIIFYKKYIYSRLDKIIISLFIFGDIIVAFKNLDMKFSGIYIAMSIFTKFVFLGYIFMKQTYKKVLIAERDTEDNVLNIFYTQINSMISTFAVLFIFFFILSKFITEIFFGNGYLPYQSSLPFVLLANISLVVALCIYTTAIRLNARLTKKIFNIYLSLFVVLFVFMTINYVDTVTYFIIGSAALLSIFLYNFVIKKPAYIENTYNLLF